MSRLIKIFTVCLVNYFYSNNYNMKQTRSLSEFTWCPKLPDFALYGLCFLLVTLCMVLFVFSAKSAASPCASKVVTDASVYIWNDNYPSAMQPEHSGCTCSIETSCDTHIQITALDVRLIETGGECQQRVVITDDGESTGIGCEANNNYRAKTVYTSTSSFIILELVNMMTKNNGYFWFHITGKSAISNMNRNL